MERSSPSSSPRRAAASPSSNSLSRLAVILSAAACLAWAAGCGDGAEDDPQNQGGSGGTGGVGGMGGGEGGSGGETTEASFSTEALSYTATLGAGEGVAPVCYDFDEEEEVDCEGEDGRWDLMFELANRSYNIWTNGGIHGAGEGAAFGPLTTEEAEEVRSSRDVFMWFTDYLGGTFSDHPWQSYDVLGMHDITPNFRVYVVDTGADLYRIQFLSYYGEGRASGFITLRYGLLGEEAFDEIQIDASSRDHFAYFDLDTGTLLELDDELARTENTTWDLGLKRYDVIVNGGASGPGQARAAIARDQADLYDDEGQPIRAAFEAFTEEMALALFNEVGAEEELSFVADEAKPFLINDGGTQSWFLYEHPGKFAPNPDAWWVIRSAEGESYAKMRVVGIDATDRSFSVELYVQPRAK